jgi:hypothetical protein
MTLLLTYPEHRQSPGSRPRIGVPGATDTGAAEETGDPTNGRGGTGDTGAAEETKVRRSLRPMVKSGTRASQTQLYSIYSIIHLYLCYWHWQRSPISHSQFLGHRCALLWLLLIHPLVRLGTMFELILRVLVTKLVVTARTNLLSSWSGTFIFIFPPNATK